jgi:hypothetical protein
MCKRVPVSLALGIAVFGLACSDRPESSSMPTDPQLAPTATCDFRAIKSGVRDYFLVNEERQVLDIVSAMETACNATTPAPATQTDKGYSVIRYIERALNGEFAVETRTGTAQTAATLLSNLFAKMPNAQVASNTNFLPVTSDKGLLGVRGGPDDPNFEPVVSRGLTPKWGIEPPSTTGEVGGDFYTSDFSAMTGGVRAAYYGSVPSSFTTLQTLTGDPRYSIHASQAVTFSPEAIVGTCFATTDASPNRLQHKKSAGGVPLLALQIPLLCGPKIVVMTAEPEPATFAGRLLRLGEQLFAPAPLQAAALGKSGGGGGISTLSDFEYVKAGSLVQSFNPDPPADAHIDQQTSATVEVVAPGAGNTKVPIEGVTVTLQVAGNSGSWNLDPSSPSGVTDENGRTTITFSLDKTGGYTITATATVEGYTITPVTSLMFHIIP